ncbi:response regulator [Flexithrix dorotheae]|uniref:response regulator n=1 Tax=Flexithrix dorotheae TaxID=70993 RepID=UPI000378FB7D|nr:response regulator [Flexithrix dorotheae]
MNKPPRILIVDDFQSIRRVLGNTLTTHGFEITEAENGKKALDFLLGSNQPIDLILSDYNMPEMNGFEFLESVKKSNSLKNIPFVLLTSETSREKMKEAKAAGLDAWIEKPYKIEAFITQIKYCIEKSQSNESV